jgi:hypothetical protein
MKEVLGFVNCGFDEEKFLISVHKSEDCSMWCFQDICAKCKMIIKEYARKGVTAHWVHCKYDNPSTGLDDIDFYIVWRTMREFNAL